MVVHERQTDTHTRTHTHTHTHTHTQKDRQRQADRLGRSGVCVCVCVCVCLSVCLSVDLSVCLSTSPVSLNLFFLPLSLLRLLQFCPCMASCRAPLSARPLPLRLPHRVAAAPIPRPPSLRPPHPVRSSSRCPQINCRRDRGKQKTLQVLIQSSPFSQYHRP